MTGVNSRLKNVQVRDLRFSFSLWGILAPCGVSKGSESFFDVHLFRKHVASSKLGVGIVPGRGAKPSRKTGNEVGATVTGRRPLNSGIKHDFDSADNSVLDVDRPGSSGVNAWTRKDTKNKNIAIKAAQDAKEAEDYQQSAALAAAREVKMQLAEKAHQASKAAEAALNGKQAFVEHLEEQVKDAQVVAQRELESCMQTQENLQLALAAAAQAGHLLKGLTLSLQISEANLINNQKAAVGTQHELSEKAALYDSARYRAEALLQELHSARQDLCAIKQAACRAMMAAKSAECNAQHGRRSLRSFKKSFEELLRMRRPVRTCRSFSGV